MSTPVPGSSVVDLVEWESFAAQDTLEFLRVNRTRMSPLALELDDRYFTLEGQRESLRASAQAREDGHQQIFGVVPTGQQTLVGYISLSPIVRGLFQNAYLSYIIDAKHCGLGFASAAVNAVSLKAFSDLSLHRLEATVLPRNAGSIRVLEKCAFRQEGRALRFVNINGVWEDHFVYAKTVED